MAKELELKYGCNPNQKPSRIFMKEGELPITVLNGRPGYINFMDALNSWQLVRELKAATGLPAAASFKHVSPAGAAVGTPLDETMRQIYFVGDLELSPIACAYARARGADRMSSYGDFIALSDECDEVTARLISREVSDGVIAPSYSDAALEILKKKRKGSYNVIQIDPEYVPAATEQRDIFGITFEQGRNELHISDELFANIVTENKDRSRSSTPSPTLSAMLKMDRLLGLERDSSPESTVPALPEIRRISGFCASIRKSLASSLSIKSAGQTVITPSTCISPTITWTCWRMAPGSKLSR